MKSFVLVSNCQEADLPGADGNAPDLSLKVLIRFESIPKPIPSSA
jgi:hypothetical protein